MLPYQGPDPDPSPNPNLTHNPGEGRRGIGLSDGAWLRGVVQVPPPSATQGVVALQEGDY